MEDENMEVDPAESDLIPLPADPEPSRTGFPPPLVPPTMLVPSFTKIATSEEISKNIELMTESSSSSSVLPKKAANPSKSSSREKTSSDNGKNSERDIPAVEYAELRKDFNRNLREMFSSSKPHSKSRILAVSGLAVKKSYMYKAVDIALSTELDKMFQTSNYDGIRAGFFLMDAIISNARKKFGKKEPFSGRLFPLLKTLLDRLMKLSPAVISKGEKEKTAQKKQVSQLRKTKREVLRIVNLWMEKKYFKDTSFLKEAFDMWAPHFPELKALEKTPAKKVLLKKKPESEKSKSKPEAPKAKVKEKEPLKVETKPPLETPKVNPVIPSPAASAVATVISTTGGGMDLESRVRAMAASGRLPAPGFHLKPPELPLYATVPLTKLLQAPALLPPPIPPPVLLGAAADPLSAFYKDIQGTANANRPQEVPRHMPLIRSVDPLEYVSKWHGYAPRNRPNHFTVVSNLLSLHYLPKKEAADPKSNEQLIRELCGCRAFGCVKHVFMSQTSAVVVMENRFAANKIKKYITEHSAPSRLPPIQFAPDVQNFINLIRCKKVLLEWHPSAIIKNQYLKYWESTPQGVAFIPYDVCNDYVHDLGYEGTTSFSPQKFGRFAKELLSGKDTVIVVDSLPPNFPQCKEIYHQVLMQVFPEALQRPHGY